MGIAHVQKPDWREMKCLRCRFVENLALWPCRTAPSTAETPDAVGSGKASSAFPPPGYFCEASRVGLASAPPQLIKLTKKKKKGFPESTAFPTANAGEKSEGGASRCSVRCRVKIASRDFSTGCLERKLKRACGICRTLHGIISPMCEGEQVRVGQYSSSRTTFTFRCRDQRIDVCHCAPHAVLEVTRHK